MGMNIWSLGKWMEWDGMGLADGYPSYHLVWRHFVCSLFTFAVGFFGCLHTLISLHDGDFDFFFCCGVGVVD
jgi:hypothetical protein